MMTGPSVVCDDCRSTYLGAPYYQFDPEDCVTTHAPGDALSHPACTGNLCPDCAGPFLIPDVADDPRRPLANSPEDRATMDEMIAHIVRGS